MAQGPLAESRHVAPVGLVYCLAVMLGGCGGRTTISADQALSGHLSSGTFDVLPGVTVTLDGDLTVTARGDIHIDGNVVPADGVSASLYLGSEEGSIHIAGRIIAGRGVNKGLVDAPGTAIAEAGGPGGSITLAAPRGSVYVRGEVESGAGGQGGFARATGNAGLIFAEGGSGGPAGRIIVQAGDIVDVTNGTLRGGAAGSGGWAVAQFANAPEIDTNVAVGNPLTAHQRELLDVALRDLRKAPEKIRTRAVAGGAGLGGIIELQLAAGGREMLLQGVVQGGLGGRSGEAKARLGHEATAISMAGGVGGDVVLGATPLQLHAITAPAAGRGRDSERAVAFAVDTVLASAGAGGVAGQVLQQGLKIGVADAGDAGAAVAQTFNPPQRRAEPPRMHAAETPGSAFQVSLP